MCRLFGAISKEPIKIDFWTYEAANSLEKQSKEHKDGWGFSWKRNEKLVTEKSINPAYEDKKFNEIFRTLKSDFFIIHIRKISKGMLRIRETQPFTNGSWIFAHNGTIKQTERIKPLINLGQMKGETDSEMFFRLLLKNMKNNNIDLAIESTVKSISKNSDYTSLNFLASNGQKLYALCKYKEKPKYYTLYWLRQNDSILIASEKLSHDSWAPLGNHELMIVDKALNIEKRIL